PRRRRRRDLVATGLEPPRDPPLAGVEAEDGRVADEARLGQPRGDLAGAGAVGDLDLHLALRGAARAVAVAPGGADDHRQRDHAQRGGDGEDDEGAFHGGLHAVCLPPAACASSQRRRMIAAASLSTTWRRRARERSAARRTSSASTVLKLSSQSSTGTSIAARNRSANASALFAAGPRSPSGDNGSPSTTRPAPWARTRS